MWSEGIGSGKRKVQRRSHTLIQTIGTTCGFLPHIEEKEDMGEETGDDISSKLNLQCLWHITQSEKPGWADWGTFLLMYRPMWLLSQSVSVTTASFPGSALCLQETPALHSWDALPASFFLEDRIVWSLHLKVRRNISLNLSLSLTSQLKACWHGKAVVTFLGYFTVFNFQVVIWEITAI